MRSIGSYLPETFTMQFLYTTWDFKSHIKCVSTTKIRLKSFSLIPKFLFNLYDTKEWLAPISIKAQTLEL